MILTTLLQNLSFIYLHMIQTYFTERILNEQLIFVGKWLCANKLSINIEKSNFVLFHSPQKKVNYSMHLKIHNNKMKEKKSVKYLGVIIDCNLNWKDHIYVFELCKKTSKGIGILFKLRDFVPIDTLIQVYYTAIYIFICALSWYGDIHTKVICTHYRSCKRRL